MRVLPRAVISRAAAARGVSDSAPRIRDTQQMSWLHVRIPGRALAADEVLRRLGRRGGATDLLRRAVIQDGAWEPGVVPKAGPIAAGTALCASVRPVRAFRPPPQGPLRLLVPRLPWPEGSLAGWRFVRRATRDGLDDLWAEAEADATVDDLFTALADERAAVLGDVRRGGVLVEGGLRARPAASDEPEGWWPAEAWAPPEGAELRVSEATRRALAGGHPWVLADRGLGDLGAFPSGHLVELRAAGGAEAGDARIDGEGSLAARRWSVAGTPTGTIAERVARAVDRRRAFLDGHAEPAGTDAYRLVHGQADGLPGLAVDRLGDVLRVLVHGRAALGLRDEVLRVLRRGVAGLAPELPWIEVVTVRAPRESRVRGVTHSEGWTPPSTWTVNEAGLPFLVDAGLDEPHRPRPGFGLFLDQRENRAWVRARAEGGCFANLFAHTGSFSAALLAGGARKVFSVDLSAPYLARLEANLGAARLLGEPHESVRGDARRFLERGADGVPFDGIVIDPPTAAAAGRRYWSVRADLPPLLALALGRLRPGGWLLVTRNERQAREPLRELVGRVAAEAGREVSALEDAPPASDFPHLRGFPEGDAFEGVCLRIAS